MAFGKRSVFSFKPSPLLLGNPRCLKTLLPCRLHSHLRVAVVPTRYFFVHIHAPRIKQPIHMNKLPFAWQMPQSSSRTLSVVERCVFWHDCSALCCKRNAWQNKQLLIMVGVTLKAAFTSAHFQMYRKHAICRTFRKRTAKKHRPRVPIWRHKRNAGLQHASETHGKAHLFCASCCTFANRQM